MNLSPRSANHPNNHLGNHSDDHPDDHPTEQLSDRPTDIPPDRKSLFDSAPPTLWTLLMIVVVSLFQAGCSVLGIRSEETPKYEVLVREDDLEIRSYAKHIVAKTVVEAGVEDPQREGFRRLAGYIFGGNQRKESISMTAPVTQTEKAEVQGGAVSRDGQKIAMTAPVTELAQDGGWVMTFMMPSKYTLESLPEPQDPRVRIEVMPERIVGAIRFSGSRRNDSKLRKLTNWLATRSEYEMASGPVYAGYDPPWTLPFLRRNEILIELRTKAEK